MIYTLRIPMHTPLVVQAIGKKDGKVVLMVTDAPAGHEDSIGQTLRYTQEWLDTSPSVTQGDNL